jgi:hypothetical protein
LNWQNDQPWASCYFVDYQPTSENMVLILLKELPIDCQKEYSFFLKTARNRIFFAEWFAQ